MEKLKSLVTKGLSQQGLAVEEDRGGLALTNLPGDQHVSLWIDETERVVRADSSLCYPIDDFSPELCRALDYLNRIRAGVSYSYRESNRALFATTMWTSPNRDPSPNQLHLLVGLLLEARERDAPGLQRVAEGEAGWEDVVDEAVDPRISNATLRFANTATGAFNRSSLEERSGTGAFETNRWSEFMNVAEGDSPQGRAGTGRQARPPGTGRTAGRVTMSDLDEPLPGRRGGLGDLPTRKLEAAPSRPTPRRVREPRDGGEEHDEERPSEFTPQKGLSRQALAMAINSVDRSEHAKVDMTRPPSFVGGMFRVLFVLAVIAGAGYGAVYYYQQTTGQDVLGATWEMLGGAFEQTVLSPEELKYKERKDKLQQEGPGLSLFLEELRAPLADDVRHHEILSQCFEALGDTARGALVDVIVTPTEGSSTRLAAYTLWKDKGHAKPPGARLGLLKKLHDADRVDIASDEIAAQLLSSLKESTTSDELLIETLQWAPPVLWKIVIERLGRPGEGAEARANALDGQVAKEEGEEYLALQALLKTGKSPPDTGLLLMQGKGVKWAMGPAREQYLALATEQPASLEALYTGQEAERLAALELATELQSPTGVRLLIEAARGDESEKIRMRALRTMRELKLEEFVWPLVVMLNEGEQKLGAQAYQEVVDTLTVLPEALTVGQLRPHLGPSRGLGERYGAIKGLGVINSPGAVQALIEFGCRDEDPRLRRESLRLLIGMVGKLRSSVSRGLSTFRSLSRNDPNPKVRELAGRLYQTLIRR